MPAHRTVWHVAWCRPNRGVRIGTQTIDPSVRKPHFAPHWVYETVRRGEIRVSVNGAVFNESLAPSLPIGGVGNGPAGWKSGSDATAKKFCLGLSGTTSPTREGYPPFRIDPMHYVFSRAGTGANEGRMVPFYSVSRLIKKHYPYGFGCVGMLVNDGKFVENSVDGGWQDGQSLRPNIPLTRTLVAWTRSGEFFIISANGGMNTQSPGSLPPGDGATWSDAVTFLRRGLPGFIQEQYGACWKSAQPPRIWGAAMFDGGPSAQIGYKRIDRRGWINLDRSAPHGNETAPNFQIPSMLYAIGPASNRRR